MESTVVVRFIYRTYSRSREGSQLDGIKDSVLQSHPTCSFSEGENVFWPIDPRQADQLRNRGILLTERGDTMCAIVQELVCTIKVANHAVGTEVAAVLLSEFPKTFAAASVETTYFTNVHAV